ncbi:MAG: hypothetical protein NT167_19090 [Verrucomicrobia bacterium]|nr:hypothetical protein [Verrucomicrobiota bacterium]
MPKNNTKQHSLIWRVCRWLVLAVGAVTLFQSGYFLVMRLAFNITIGLPSLAEKIAFALVNLTAVVFLAWLFYRPFCRGVVRLARRQDGRPTLLKRAFGRLVNKRMIPRYLFWLACLATLLGIFYAVEDWRGKRAWEKCRLELEAKGAVLDWNAYIPAPVPNEQNIFKAPKMTEWFVKESWTGALSGNLSQSRNTNAPFSLAPHQDAKAGLVLVAEVDVVPSNGPLPPGKADAVLRFDDPAAREQAAKLLRERIGPSAEGATSYGLLARPFDQINPVHLVLQADAVPTSKALDEFLSASFRHFKVVPVGSNRFRVSFELRVYTAAEYLALSQSAVADLDLLREALKRPFARMDSGYERPFGRPIPNFVRLRTVAQMLSQRAQCYLLLGQPEAAWHELALVRDLCRLLEGKPASNAATLVEAMIDVAITGLYTSIVQDGLRLQAWREPELAAMQKQLMDVNLLPLVRTSFKAERAAVCRTMEITPPAELTKLFFFDREPLGLWQKLSNPMYLLIWFMPRGWLYQNMAAVAPCHQMAIGIFDVPNNLVLPGKTDEANMRRQPAFIHRTPYTFLGAIATPNFVKASQTMARNQTLANEAFVACGLERYRLAHGQYPESLNALVPQFAAKLPHDIIGGQPLKYHRSADGRFALYSVGWNEKDDGGVVSKAVEEGDWVWP